MTKHLLYLVGQPAAGKTTAMLAALETLGPLHTRSEPKPFLHTVYSLEPDAHIADSLVMLGGWREPFGGTDMLGMSIQPAVVSWLDRTECRNIIAEGDRLANDKFFNAVLAAGWELTVIGLEVRNEIAQARRHARGAAQSAAWIAGRITKTNRLMDTWCHHGDCISTDHHDTEHVGEMIAKRAVFDVVRALLPILPD